MAEESTVAPAQPEEPVIPERRSWWKYSRLILVCAALTLIAAHLLLLAPMIAKPRYARIIKVDAHLAYPFNSDSPLYLQMAHNPGMLLEKDNPRQARPGYVWIGAVGAKVVAPVLRAVGIERPYGQRDPAYLPLLLFNYVIVVAALVVLVLLLRELLVPWSVVAALGTVLLINDVTKPFFWTPHQQMFILLVPLLTVLAVRRVRQRQLSWRATVGLAVFIGLGLLVYGNFVIMAAAVGIALLLRRDRTITRWAHLRDQLGRIAVFGAVALAPTVAWMVVCRVVAGSYYNHELVRYRQFVWLAEAMAQGPAAFFDRVAHYTGEYLKGMAAGAGPVVILLIVVALAAVLGRARFTPAAGRERHLLIAIGLTTVVTVVFCWAIGFYQARLMENVVPPLLVLIGWLSARLAARSTRHAVAVGVALPVIAAGWAWYEITKVGPYF